MKIEVVPEKRKAVFLIAVCSLIVGTVLLAFLWDRERFRQQYIIARDYLRAHCRRQS